jgi:diguanylate cyclase (GGDEF)-like protein/PAS domain S-box-containing protein
MIKPQLHVLVVDDDAGMRDALRGSVENGFAPDPVAVEEASSFEEAVGLLESRVYDALLVDVRLPRGRTGLDILAEARNRGIDAPAIVITGQGDESFAVQAMKAGASDYLVKSELTIDRIRDSIRRALANAENVALRKSAAEALAKLAAIVENSQDAIISETLDGRVEIWNPAAEKLFGYSAEEAVGKSIRNLVPAEKLAEEEDILRRVGGGEAVEPFETERIRKDGTRVAVSVAVSPIRDTAGAIFGLSKIARDVSERKKFDEQRRLLEEQIRFQAFHDVLTGLPNRSLFEDRLALAIAQADRNAEGLCVMFLDLDHFKAINDGHGHAVGDGVLRTVANRLRGSIREHDSVSRIGGDEFLLLFPELGDREDAERVGRKVLHQFARPFEVRGLSLAVTASIGIAIYRERGTTADQLVKSADAAMYRAKTLGRNRSSFGGVLRATGPAPPE